jgi:hypothetical protein
MDVQCKQKEPPLVGPLEESQFFLSPEKDNISIIFKFNKKNYFNKRKTSVDRSISHLPPVNRLCEIFPNFHSTEFVELSQVF